MFAASLNGHEAVVGRLIAAGTAVDKATTDIGATPLFMAVQMGHEGVAGRLIAAGVAVDTAAMGDFGATPLIMAA